MPHGYREQLDPGGTLGVPGRLAKIPARPPLASLLSCNIQLRVSGCSQFHGLYTQGPEARNLVSHTLGLTPTEPGALTMPGHRPRILWLRTDGIFSYPSSPAPPWCCFRRSHEHIVVLLSFYLSWLKRQTISVCFYSIFQVLYRVPINKVSCLENVRAWKRMQFNQQQYLIF